VLSQDEFTKKQQEQEEEIVVFNFVPWGMAKRDGW
jgi:hypothetical protein